MSFDIRKVRRGKRIADISIVITILLTLVELLFDVFTRSSSTIYFVKDIIILVVIGMYYMGNRVAFRLVMSFLPIGVLLFPGIIVFILLFGILNYLGLMDIWNGMLVIPALLLSIIFVVLLDKKMEVSDSIAEFVIFKREIRN